jgi:hypothetical protein
MNSGSVANIRITTVRNLSGKIEFRAAHLNLGRKDNQWIHANNFIQVVIRTLDGELDAHGYSQDWFRFASHPDSGFVFSDHRIPKFREAVDTCLQLHATVPHFLVVGWDIAINKDNQIQLMEWNSGHIGIKLDEAVNGPCFTGLNWEKLR